MVFTVSIAVTQEQNFTHISLALQLALCREDSRDRHQLQTFAQYAIKSPECGSSVQNIRSM